VKGLKVKGEKLEGQGCKVKNKVKAQRLKGVGGILSDMDVSYPLIPVTHLFHCH